jgi:hypothetical protein
MKGHDVYLEIGAKRVFACAVDWPGWCRGGPDEGSALQALLDYGPRYASALHSARLGFAAPSSLSELRVVERCKGNATTDFGAPAVILERDHAPADEAEYTRFAKILRAAWRALDAARKRAEGRALTKGPRGGGRDLEAILDHVAESERGYLAAFGGERVEAGPKGDRATATRGAIMASLALSKAGGIAARGPRGGRRWPVRYFVRRVAWHALAHAWEIERRLQPAAPASRRAVS